MKKTRIDRFKVKKETERRGISALQELAPLAGISPTTLYSVLDSYSWRAATLDAIANALEVESIALLTVDDVTEPTERARVGQRTRRRGATGRGHAARPENLSEFTALASEEVLAREWLTPEEDEAWADL
jgi:lambda repressor-like predicted transcriptional regulator